MLDPQAKLVSCGMNGWNEWDQVVIDGMASLVDYHSLHIYTGSDDYWTNVLQPHQAERAIRCTEALIERAAYRQKIAAPPRIAYDEWNVWYRDMTGALEERYTFADALAVGTYLNIFVRNCDWVRMANLAQMVNAIAPIVTSRRGRGRAAHLVPGAAALPGRPGPGRGRARGRAGGQPGAARRGEPVAVRIGDLGRSAWLMPPRL